MSFEPSTASRVGTAPSSHWPRTMHDANPSPFYDLLNGAEKFSLVFPPSQEGTGPYWLETGDLVCADGVDAEDEDIKAVPLGEDRYRLAEKSFGPFSSLRLHWGDEFIAERVDGNVLQLSSVVMPRRFEHYRFLTSPGFTSDNPIAMIVHQEDGGWETVAGGMLTLTVPMLRVAEFQQLIKAAELLPGVLRLVD